MGERVLSKPPGMLPLFARAGAAMIPGSSKLPFIGSARGEELPDLTLVLEQATIGQESACRVRPRLQVPAARRAACDLPAHARVSPAALADDRPELPVPALGLVHIANRIVQYRPIRISEELQLKVWAAELSPHPRGTQFEMRTEARVGEQVVWEESSTILRRGGTRSGEGESSRGREEREPEQDLPITATWRLPGDLGRRYGSVSGDMNPIHIHPLSARLFGFPTAIVHGMWTKARCLAALDPRLPDAFTVEVQFKKPILLPATVEFGELEDPPHGIEFSVRGAGKGTPHLDGPGQLRLKLTPRTRRIRRTSARSASSTLAAVSSSPSLNPASAARQRGS